jgi:LacI family transcriptional regulator
MAVTLSKLAKELGVSTMTVSRALRGVGRIGEETRKRILTAARRHRYRPHALARAMRCGRSGCVALFIGASPDRSVLPPQLAIGIDEALTARGLYLAVARLPEHGLADTDSIPRLLGESVADGMLVNHAHNAPPELIAQLCEHRVPCVWINARRPHDCVHADDRAAARRATQTLIDLGHRRIAFANHAQSRADDQPDDPAAQERYQGYAMELSAAGLATHRIYRHPLVRFVEMWRSFLSVPANQRPTAVLAHSRFTAHPILLAAAQLGLQIPRDLSLISFDEEPTTEFEFPLSAMILPHRQIGQRAVEMLCTRIDDPEQPLPSIAVSAEWFEGGTIAPPRIAN